MNGISLPAGYIKCVDVNPQGVVEVRLMDGEVFHVFGTQQEAHDAWNSALRGGPGSGDLAVRGAGEAAHVV